MLLLNKSVTIHKKTITNMIGIKWVPTHVCLNLIPGIVLTNFKTKGSYVNPSLYITNKKEVNTTKVPASGCNNIKIIGTIMIALATKTEFKFCCLIFNELMYLANNKAVPVLANSAG